MDSHRLLRASIAAIIGSAAVCAGAAQSDSEELTEVTITGSRVITDNVRSPTPITSVDTAEIARTTPSDIPDALNKLPQILAGGTSGGRTPRNQGNGSTNNGGNVLSLRNFGPARTLVLLDGHRVAPSNQDGTVNVDTLPQILVSRVDLVTGGASAVYGSDAVAGVVNFVLDKKFSGFKFKADAGISEYGDAGEGQVAAAWGTDLLDGRGHFETSLRYRKQAEVPISARPLGKDGQQWLRTGAGTVANPYVNTPYARLINSAMFGAVNCGTACSYNNYTFNSPGVLSPLVHGVPTGTANVESGGDGAWIKYGTFRSGISMKDAFGRFSYDLTDDINAYVQGSVAEATNISHWVNWVVSPSANRPNTLFANNPFLAPATQAQLGAGIVCGTPAAAGWRCLPATPPTSAQTRTAPPPPPTVPYFSAPSYIWNNIDGEGVGGTNRMYLTDARQKNRNVEAGLTGTWGGFNWDAFYNHGESINKVINPNNTDNAKYLASLDAVIAPAGTVVNGVNVSGTIVCWVTTQPQFAGLYPGCVPTNITDPRGPSLGAFNYLRSMTYWSLKQKLDNVGGSIGGGLWGLGLPAGEIRANLSVDARWATYDMRSNALPTEFVDCTGLRMCLANASATPLGPSSPVRWVQNTNAPVSAKNHVIEGALEVNVPLLKDLPLIQELSTDWAGRYTKYSSFSSVESWKGGLDWHVNDTIRFRGTLSQDIRAPNLNDLYQPQGVSSANFTDKLTNSTNTTRVVSQGNANLTPERARTVTVGLVLTPSFLPAFNFSVDYFETKMRDAIIPVDYNTVQDLCIASAPAFDSPFCSLAVRPITNASDPNFRVGSANFPISILNAPLNAARQWTHGVDFQLNYGWDMNQLIAAVPGHVSFRHLGTYQPVNSTVNLPGQFANWQRQPKLRQTTFLTYEYADWTVSLQNLWYGKLRLATSDNAVNGGAANPTGTQNYAQPFVPTYDLLDVTISKRFEMAKGGRAEAFLTVSNVTDKKAPVVGSDSGLPGLFYGTLGNYDDMGRFFTAGIKVEF